MERLYDRIFTELFENVAQQIVSSNVCAFSIGIIAKLDEFFEFTLEFCHIVSFENYADRAFLELTAASAIFRFLFSLKSSVYIRVTRKIVFLSISTWL